MAANCPEVIQLSDRLRKDFISLEGKRKTESQIDGLATQWNEMLNIGRITILLVKNYFLFYLIQLENIDILIPIFNPHVRSVIETFFFLIKIQQLI